MTAADEHPPPVTPKEWTENLSRDYPGLRSTSKLVARYLADFANFDTGRGAYPSQETLAERAGCTERTVRYALKQLEQAGAIRRQPWRRHRVVVYDLVPGNRHARSGYDDGKTESQGHVTGKPGSHKRNARAANQLDPSDQRGEQRPGGAAERGGAPRRDTQTPTPGTFTPEVLDLPKNPAPMPEALRQQLRRSSKAG